MTKSTYDGYAWIVNPEKGTFNVFLVLDCDHQYRFDIWRFKTDKGLLYTFRMLNVTVIERLAV